MTTGGLLLDGVGDIAWANANDSLADMVRTRLRASLNGWQCYPIGADLEARLGDTLSAQLELQVQMQTSDSLSYQFLDRGTFSVQTTTAGQQMDVYVYLGQSLLAVATINLATQQLQVTS